MNKKENGIFGLRPIIEAIESGKTIDKLFVQKGLQGETYLQLNQLVREHRIPVQYVPIEKLNRFTRKNHQGVYAFLSPIDFYRIENLLPQIWEKGENPLILILDRVSDVRNFGAIARTAEIVGADAIIIPEKGSAAVNADAVKTSAGALFNIKVCKERDLGRAVRFLQESGIAVISATEKAEEYIYDADLSVPCAIVVGSEDDGVSNDLLKMSDQIARLPMSGKTSSLNVSVASGIFLYEAVRQRGEFLK